jgi:hypothetical protein
MEYEVTLKNKRTGERITMEMPLIFVDGMPTFDYTSNEWDFIVAIPLGRRKPYGDDTIYFRG